MRWQYKTLICANNYELRKKLNNAGKYGWEAYSVILKEYAFDEVYIAYLKRPKK